MDYLHKQKQLLKSKYPELCQFPKIFIKASQLFYKTVPEATEAFFNGEGLSHQLKTVKFSVVYCFL